MSTAVKRDGESVWLAGVPTNLIGDKQSSIHAAQAAAVQAAGLDADYEYLVGVSSLAFRMQVSKDGL